MSGGAGQCLAGPVALVNFLAVTVKGLVVTVRVWAATVHRVVATDKERVGPGSRVAGTVQALVEAVRAGVEPALVVGLVNRAARPVKRWVGLVNQTLGATSRVSRRFAYWGGNAGRPRRRHSKRLRGPIRWPSRCGACERQSFFGCGNLYRSGDRQTHSSSASSG